MNEWLPLALAFAAGLLLSAFYHSALWWTVSRGVSSKRPALWFSGSLLLRMSVAVGGFYLVGRGHWERFVVCLLGFVMTRMLVAWLAGSSAGTRPRPAQEASHAS